MLRLPALHAHTQKSAFRCRCDAQQTCASINDACWPLREMRGEPGQTCCISAGLSAKPLPLLLTPTATSRGTCVHTLSGQEAGMNGSTPLLCLTRWLTIMNDRQHEPIGVAMSDGAKARMSSICTA